MKTEQAAFASRLQKLLAQKKFEASPVELAALLARHGASVTPQTISGWLSGAFMPRIGNQRALAAMLEVELQALQQDRRPADEVREQRMAWPAGLDGKDVVALREFATLPSSQRKLIRELIAALASGAPQKPGR